MIIKKDQYKKTKERNTGRRLVFLSAFIVVILLLLIIDYRGPASISLKNDTVFGMECLRAPGLLVQEYDSAGNLWASRGMVIYRLDKNAVSFRRIAHVPTGLTPLWIRNFSLVRKLTIRPECIEMTVAADGDIYAASAGKVWLMRAGEKKFTDVYTLNHYGMGDQGLRNDGILASRSSDIYLGEYFQNPGREKVNIIKIDKKGGNPANVHEFAPGAIRHIHSLQEDPFTGKLWVCTGDDDHEPFVGWSSDGFKSIEKIGEGNQTWRVCQLVFTENTVIWGADTGEAEYAGIFSYNRQTGELRKISEVGGAVFFATALANGTIILSTNREAMDNETDDKVRFYIVGPDDKVRVIEGGTWHHKKKGFWYKYAQLRFQRYQGAEALAVSCLNIKEFPDSELLIFPQAAFDNIKTIK